MCRYLFELMFSFPLYIFPEVELLNHIVLLFLMFENPPYYFAKWLYQSTVLPTGYNNSFSPHPHQHFFSLVLIEVAFLMGMR